MNSKRKINVLLLVSLSLILVSCEPGNSSNVSMDGFHWIYDKSDTVNYSAVDFKEKDGGFIILGKVEQKPYLLKVNRFGHFIWDTDVETFAGYFDPARDILEIDDKYCFFCNMKKKEERHGHLALIKFNETQRNFTAVKLYRASLQISGIVPLAAMRLPDKHILFFVMNLGFENDDKVILYNFRLDGISAKTQYKSLFHCVNKYPIYDGRFHFINLIENSKDKLYNFQTYSENIAAQFPDCFRITTIDPTDFKLEFIETRLLSKPFIAMVWHNRREFSGARMENNIVTFYINAEVIKPDLIEGPYPLEIDESLGYPKSELDESKAVYMGAHHVNDRQIVFFAGSARNNQIVLYAYERFTGEPKGERYFGHFHRYEACGLAITNDGGLAILGTTYFMGRYKRICLFKLSKAELEDMVSQGD